MVLTRCNRRSRRTRRNKRATRYQRGGSLKEEALQALKDAGINTSNAGLEKFTFSSGKFKRNSGGHHYIPIEIGEFTFDLQRPSYKDFVLKAYKTSNSADSVNLAYYSD
jgi:hypothetical protein